MKLNEMIPPPPVTARHTHSPKLLLCSHFEENNSMRHFRTQNLVCNHRNLRLFDAQRRIISHQCLGLFVGVWRAYVGRMYVAHTHGFGTRACVRVQDMTRAHVKMKSKEKNGTFQIYYLSAIVCCSNVFVCNQCIRS